MRLAKAIYGYDAASRLSTVSDGTNNAAYSCLANSPLVSQIAFKSNSVTRMTTTKTCEYFRDELPASNSSAALWTNIIITATGQTSVTGNVYVAKQPEVFSYDADGNLTNDGRWAYTWDGENRLTGMTTNTSVGPQYKLTFAYDWQGRRIQKMVSTNGVGVYTNRFLYDGWNLIAEVNPASSLVRSYVWGSDLSGSQQGAGGVGGLLEVSFGTTNCFPAFDGNGNVAALINAADGTIAANYDYGAFGEPIRITGVMAINNPFRFSSKYDDDESDLLYYGYRYYKSSTGTWPNRDPIAEAGGENLYRFSANNPFYYLDFLGLLEATYKGYSSGHFREHQSYLIFEAKCPCFERVKVGPNSSGIQINKKDIADAIINDLQQAISVLEAEINTLEGDPNINAGTIELIQVDQAIANKYQQGINNLNKDIDHVSGVKQISNLNCGGNPVGIQIYMNTRFGSGWPIDWDPRHVKDEIDTYIKTAKVTYECELCK